MTQKTRILFVCHGNICRSTTAEFVFKQKVADAGVAERYEIGSAGTSDEELGNPVYPPARRILERHGIDCSGKRARQLTRADYDRWDLLIGMDFANVANMRRLFGGDPDGKISLMFSWVGEEKEVDDPWYHRDFERAYRDIDRCCAALLKATSTDAEEER